jgi:hypothetical protein
VNTQTLPPQQLFRLPSPNGQFAVVVSDGCSPHVTVENAAGECLYNGRDAVQFRFAFRFYPEYFAWTADSRTIAITAGYPAHIRTYVLTNTGAAFENVSTPWVAEGFPNPWITPDRWLTSAVLKLAISGPHRPEVTGPAYEGEAKLKVIPQPPSCELVSERICELS